MTVWRMRVVFCVTKAPYTLRICNTSCFSTTLVLKESIIRRLSVFERKILRKIFGPTKEDNGIWRIKANKELDELI
jgi:hypothetical protein